ncbi:hypothetical protein MA16_Dca010348 [Dendrobium catenatum]|uniref:Uncharacterized protein n=1 Tax=Dendrobium catenatum TaxID=906689 RepID=A0A2I0X837_9ASPA|nr:hypothetical protein MA16_Dca010348 [Dendrobium catenatum]
MTTCSGDDDRLVWWPIAGGSRGGWRLVATAGNANELSSEVNSLKKTLAKKIDNLESASLRSPCGKPSIRLEDSNECLPMKNNLDTPSGQNPIQSENAAITLHEIDNENRLVSFLLTPKLRPSEAEVLLCQQQMSDFYPTSDLHSSPSFYSTPDFYRLSDIVGRLREDGFLSIVGLLPDAIF